MRIGEDRGGDYVGGQGGGDRLFAKLAIYKQKEKAK